MEICQHPVLLPKMLIANLEPKKKKLEKILRLRFHNNYWIKSSHWITNCFLGTFPTSFIILALLFSSFFLFFFFFFFLIMLGCSNARQTLYHWAPAPAQHSTNFHSSLPLFLCMNIPSSGIYWTVGEPLCMLFFLRLLGKCECWLGKGII
jgi:hypothetical protein